MRSVFSQRRFPMVMVLMLIWLSLQACAVNPATGSPNLVLMSENRELEIGKEEHDKVMATMRVV
ncbi:MAG: peptidase M48, partial [Pseudohongiella sp.]|nr:peptidase M48 [Pseudohongiella sp.]